MGRAPCCDKDNVKKGPWSPEEDNKLREFIQKHGTGGNWIALPQKIGLRRCGKSCRLRWLNYLRPNLKHGGFSEEEDNIICSLYASIGSRWSIIASQLPGRTDNDIKNYWNTKLKKKLLGNRKEQLQTLNASSAINGEKKLDHPLVTFSTVGQQNSYWSQPGVLSSTSLLHQMEDPSLYHQQSFSELLRMTEGTIPSDFCQSDEKKISAWQRLYTNNYGSPNNDFSFSEASSSVNGGDHGSPIMNQYKVEKSMNHMFEERSSIDFPVQLNHMQAVERLDSVYELENTNWSDLISSTSCGSDFPFLSQQGLVPASVLEPSYIVS